MVEHTQTIRRLLPTNCLSLFDHFFWGGRGLVLEGLILFPARGRLAGINSSLSNKFFVNNKNLLNQEI